jgi:hypothetical protein
MRIPFPTHIPATPSVDQVVAALNRTALPQRARLRLSTAAMLSMVMGTALVLLLAAFAALSWVLVRETERLVVDIRHQRVATVNRTADSIGAEDLLRDEAFAALLQTHPSRTADLYRQRAVARSQHAGETAAIRADFLQASQLDPQVLQSADRLYWADLELRQGDPERALRLLRECDSTRLTTAQRQHLTNLLLALHEASRR